MEKKRTGRSCRLAARLRGERLDLSSEVREAAENELLRAIRRAERRRCHPDERALAVSVACERLGDFFLGLGARRAAVKAYRESAVACLCGDYYEGPDDLYPCRLLRLRFLRQVERAAACAGGDARLRALVTGDGTLCGEYTRLNY